MDKPWLKYYSEDISNVKIPDMSMYEYLREENKENLDGIAMNYMGTYITYRELIKNVDALAGALKSWGVEENEVIPTYALNMPEFVFIFYALNKLGAVPDLQYMNLTADDVRKNVLKTQPKHMITISLYVPVVSKAVTGLLQPDNILVLPLERSLPSIPRNIVRIKMYKDRKIIKRYFSYDRLLKMSENCTVTTSRADRTALIVHTGGTTGVPKGVRLSNYNANAIALQYKHSLLQLQRQDTILNIAPPFVAFGICLALHTPLCLGMHVQLSPNPDPESNGKAYKKYKPKHFLGGPAHIKNITKILKKDKDLSFAYTVGYGGESIPTDEIEEYIRFFKERKACLTHLSPGYGMTEFGGTVVVCGRDVFRDGSVGLPLALANVKIVDSDGKELKVGEEGEIYLTSPSLMLGYTNTENNCFHIDDKGTTWIKTGDLGYMDEDGFLFLRGRIKRMFLIKGLDGAVTKIYPDYIEDNLMKMEQVNNCAVVVIEKNKAHYSPIAFIETVDRKDVSKEEVIRFCKTCLPIYEIPEHIIFLEKIPTTNSGKKDYRKLEEQAFKLLRSNG